MAKQNNTEKQYLFDNPKNVKRLLYVVYAICIVLVLLDFVIHRHIYHSWESLFGFYAIYGFVGCVVLVLVAKWMRTFLMRDEDYYDRIELKQNKTQNETQEKKAGGEHVDD
ncbi:hypothetical protein [Kangiella koreensis]|uniref:2TM domain-containing protein n=1 Tax=Kangiella koreensis (strain DSM 16069 / JCM 12317 / KCTC 12182 / SW-125) TaxID=523791 RepID=C7RA72_KANKD|nr:hypothetical protein [Kangiella koreensis]ACV26191.1 conserved hypothetical protein [Kangiella koreensis DSM 16069]